MSVYAAFRVLAETAVYVGGLVALVCVVFLVRGASWTNPQVRRCVSILLFVLPAFGLFRLLSAPLDSQNSFEILLLAVLVLAGLAVRARRHVSANANQDAGRQTPI